MLLQQKAILVGEKAGHVILHFCRQQHEDNRIKAVFQTAIRYSCAGALPQTPRFIALQRTFIHLRASQSRVKRKSTVLRRYPMSSPQRRSSRSSPLLYPPMQQGDDSRLKLRFQSFESPRIGSRQRFCACTSGCNLPIGTLLTEIYERCEAGEVASRFTIEFRHGIMMRKLAVGQLSIQPGGE